jgi:hypothetical protein
MRKAAILLLLAAQALPVSAPARAADNDAKKGEPGTNVEMPFLMAPLTNADGKLLGYAYISTRLTAMSDTYALAVRDKLPFIQHAMVLDVNAEPVAGPDDPKKVDIPGLEKRLLADAAKVLGAGKVKAITVCTVQIADLHPVQTPAHNAPPGAAAAEKSRCES